MGADTQGEGASSEGKLASVQAADAPIDGSPSGHFSGSDDCEAESLFARLDRLLLFIGNFE